MPVCVAGMHRSGTSLVTRLLNLCGLDLGPEADLLPAAPDNPEGFWENRHFVELNDALLFHLNGTWESVPPLRPGWHDDTALDELKARARQVRDHFAGHAPWGWKDPRNCLTLPFWQSVIGPLALVIPVRHPIEVAHSLRARSQLPLEAGVQLWYGYNTRLLEIAKNGPCVVCHYDSYFAHPLKALNHLVGTLGFVVEPDLLRRAIEAVSPHLRHQRRHDLNAEEEKMPPHVEELYDRLCRLATQAPKRVLPLPNGPARHPAPLSVRDTGAQPQPSAGRGDSSCQDALEGSLLPSPGSSPPVCARNVHHAQLFYSDDGEFTEHKSMGRVYAADRSVQLVFDGARGKLRLDPTCQPAAVELRFCLVQSMTSGVILFRATTASELAVLRPGGDAFCARDAETLTVLCNGSDAQIYFPDQPEFQSDVLRIIVGMKTVARTVKQNADFCQQLGFERAENGDWEGACRAWSDAIRFSPGQDPLRPSAGAPLMELDRLTVAETAARRVLRQQPNHLESLRLLAAMLRRRDAFEQAFTVYSQIVRITPKDTEASLGRAVCSAAQGQKVLARLLVEELLMEHPSHPEAKALLAEFQRGTISSEAPSLPASVV